MDSITHESINNINAIQSVKQKEPYTHIYSTPMAKSSSDSKSTAKSLRQQVRDYISQQGHGTFNYKQVAAALGVNSQSQLRSIAMTIAEMDFDGDLLQVAPGKYKLPQRSNVTTGTFVRRSNGKNSVITDADGESIFVAERNSLHALNGDKVKVIIAARRQGVEPEAEVIEITEPLDQTFIGTLHVEKVCHTSAPTPNFSPTT